MTLGDAEEGRGDRLGCRGELAVFWARAASWLLLSLAGTSCVPRRRTLFAGLLSGYKRCFVKRRSYKQF
jgi:hypothetical protein